MARDPTKVVTRRCLAFLVDAPVVVLIVAFVAFVTPGAFDVEGDCPVPAPGGEACVQWKDDAYRIDGRSFLVFALLLVVLLVIVLGGTKRMTGASPGKALFGIRVVDAAGDHAGLARRTAHGCPGRRRGHAPAPHRALAGPVHARPPTHRGPPRRHLGRARRRRRRPARLTSAS